MSPIKLVILDIDGVIIGRRKGHNNPVPSGPVTDRILELQKKGIMVSYCTNRSFSGIGQILESTQSNGVHIVDGGAILFDAGKHAPTVQHIIDPVDVSAAIDFSERHQAHIEVYILDRYFIQRSQSTSIIVPEHSRILGQEPEVVSSLADVATRYPVVRILAVLPDQQSSEQFTADWKSEGLSASLHWGVHPTLLPHQFGVITATGVSKKKGMCELLAQAGVSSDQTLGIGDWISDWEFMEECGYVGAMGNANDELKEKVKTKGDGHFVIGGDVDEDGILKILDHFGV